SYRPALLDLAPTPANAEPAVALTEDAAKQWLRSHGIPIPESVVVRSREEAQQAAERLGGTLVAKVVSAQIQHKSDVGGVRLGLSGGQAVGQAWDDIHASVSQAMPEAAIEGILLEPMAPAGGLEVLVGVSRDPILGHVLTFGLGGIYVELFQDVSRRMLPLTPAEADAMMQEVRCHPLLT